MEKRIMKLRCPSVSSNTLQIAVFEDQKLDLGSVSRVFGLDPNSLKLNGHFISRGLDFVASSVTWGSLIGYFSARGLSAGASSDSTGAIVVSGKLLKIGCKRSHEPPGIGMPEQGYNTRENKKAQLEYWGLLESDNLKESISGLNDATKHKPDGPDQLPFKRKLCLEDASQFKRLKSAETITGLHERNCGDSTIGKLPCSFMGKNIKRMRDDGMVASVPVKKIR